MTYEEAIKIGEQCAGTRCSDCALSSFNNGTGKGCGDYLEQLKQKSINASDPTPASANQKPRYCPLKVNGQNHLAQSPYCDGENCMWYIASFQRCAINNTLPVTNQPKPPDHWIKEASGRLFCSKCGVIAGQHSDETGWYWDATPYCPHCGTAMEAET